MFLPSNRLSGHLASKLKPSLTRAFIARCRIDQLRRETANEICQCSGIIHLAERFPFGFAARLCRHRAASGPLGQRVFQLYSMIQSTGVRQLHGPLYRTSADRRKWNERSRAAASRQSLVDTDKLTENAHGKDLRTLSAAADRPLLCDHAARMAGNARGRALGPAMGR